MADVELLVPEFEYRKKTIRWYVYFGLVSLGSILLGGLTQNYTFVGLIFFIWALVLIRQNRKPAIVPLRIDNSGISFGQIKWEYKNIKDFSILEAEGKNYLVFIPKGKFKVTIKIPITQPEPIAAKLNNYLPQVEYEEPFLEIISRRLNI